MNGNWCAVCIVSWTGALTSASCRDQAVGHRISAATNGNGGNTENDGPVG